MKRLTLIILSILTLYAAARAQEHTFSIHFPEWESPLSHAAGAGVWQGKTETGDPVSGITLNYFSRHLLLDADFARDWTVRNFHMSGFLITTLSLRTEGIFSGSIRLYPTLGVADIHDRNCRFDYGACVALTAGWRAGVSVLGRITRETKAVTINIAF